MTPPGYYHKCTLAAYRISWLDDTITALPGPTLIVNGNKMHRGGRLLTADIVVVLII